jgi:hypothetical protein
MQWECPFAALLKKSKNNDFIVTRSIGTKVNRKLIVQEVPDRLHE